MSRPQISAGSQQSRSGYPPPGTPAQPQLQRQDDTTITMRTYHPGQASTSSQGAWLATRRAQDGEGVDAGDDEGNYDESEQHAWNRALGAASAINAQIKQLCVEDVINPADLATMFRALKAARATSQLHLLYIGGEDKVYPSLGPGLLRLISKLSYALGSALDASQFDISTISAICDGLRTALGKTRSESLFSTAHLGKLKEPLRSVVDTLMQRALACGLPADLKSNHELLSILKLLSRGLKLRFTDPKGQSDTLLSKASETIGDVLWKSLLVIRDWPANPEEKGGNLSSTGMLDTRQLGVVMVQLNTMHKQIQRDLDDEVENGLSGRQLLGQCTLKLCGGNALDEFRLWSRQNDSSSMVKTSPLLARAPLQSVVVSNISNTIKDFFEPGIIPANSPTLPLIITKLVKWMQLTIASGDATPESQSFSNYANCLRVAAEPGLRGQALPVEDEAAYDEVCRLVLEGCATLKPLQAPDDGDIQHVSNLASYVKAMARRQKHPGYLYRNAAGGVIRAMAGHAADVRQPESCSGLLAACVYYMQAGVLAVQAVQPLVDALLKEGTALVKPYWPATLRKQLLQSAVSWWADPRVVRFGNAADVDLLPLFDAIFKCRKAGEESLPYLKALDLIAKRHPAQLANYLPLLSALTGRPVALTDAPGAIAAAIAGHTDEPPVVEIAVDEPPPAPAPTVQKSAPATEPARPGSANWQPIGGVLAKPAAKSGNDGDDGNDGKAAAAHKAKRKKHRPARHEQLPRSEPVTSARSDAAAAGTPGRVSSAGNNANVVPDVTRNIITNITSNAMLNIKARPAAAALLPVAGSDVAGSKAKATVTTTTTTNTKTTTTTANPTEATTTTVTVPGSATKADAHTPGKTQTASGAKAAPASASKAGDTGKSGSGAGQAPTASGAGSTNTAKKPATTQAKMTPASPQPKGTPKEQWQFHFTKSRDDIIDALPSLLEKNPSLLTQNIGNGAAAQPALFHAISRGHPAKTQWLLNQMIWVDIKFDQAEAYRILDAVFAQATLVEPGHKQAVKTFLIACQQMMPDWDNAFVAYLSDRRSTIPPAYGFGPAAAQPVADQKPQKRTRRETEDWKATLAGGTRLKNDVEADVRKHVGKHDLAIPLTSDDYQSFSAATAEKIIKSGRFGDGRDLLLKPDELGRIALMQRIENRDWGMAKAHLNAKLTTEQLLAKDGDQRTAMMMAIDQRHLPMVQDLLDAARRQGGNLLLQVLTARDSVGFTPLILACLNGEPDIVRALLGAGHVAEQLMHNHAGATAYFLARRNGDEGVIKTLLEMADAVGLRDAVMYGIDDLAAKQIAEVRQ